MSTSNFFKELFDTDAFDARFRAAKSEIECDEHENLIKIILRNLDWPSYRGIYPLGKSGLFREIIS